jgi:REP element-mobilizing transposase RayT
MPSSKYYIRNPEEVYFLTSTVVDWFDVFTRPVYKEIIVDSLRFCKDRKGLIVYGWVLMTNHLHLLVQAEEGKKLGDIMRDFKRFTANRIIETIKLENESRKEWLLHKFEWNAKYKSSHEKYQFWQAGNQAKEGDSFTFIEQKLNYIHQNPVRAAIVEHPEEYLYSSARNYIDQKGLIDITSIYG